MALTEWQVKELINQVTQEELSNRTKIDINDFLIVCDNYLNAIGAIISSLQYRKTLSERISLIGAIMHNNLLTIREMLILSHAFLVRWNNFLKRDVRLTWISNAGRTYLATEKQVLNMYSQASLSLLMQDQEKVFAGYIQGRASNFNPFDMKNEKSKVQKQLWRATENKRQVFKEGKRRYWRSQQDTDAEGEPINFPEKRVLYWAKMPEGRNGGDKNFSEKIPSAGYIGLGYLQLALQFPNTKMYPVDGPDYTDDEKYIEMLAEYALQGDSIPGIVKGDIKYNDSGDIQLAVKQGEGFHTASISGNIAIAELFKKYSLQLKDNKTIQKKIKEKVLDFTDTSWEQLYIYIEKFLILQINKKF